MGPKSFKKKGAKEEVNPLTAFFDLDGWKKTIIKGARHVELN